MYASGYSGQVMKFVYMRKTYSVCILNMRLKLELNLLNQQVIIFFFLICAEYEIEAFDATSDEIRLMVFYLNPDFIDVSLKT